MPGHRLFVDAINSRSLINNILRPHLHCLVAQCDEGGGTYVGSSRPNMPRVAKSTTKHVASALCTVYSKEAARFANCLSRVSLEKLEQQIIDVSTGVLRSYSPSPAWYAAMKGTYTEHLLRRPHVHCPVGWMESMPPTIFKLSFDYITTTP